MKATHEVTNSNHPKFLCMLCSLEFLDATDYKIHLDTHDEAQTNPVLEPVVTVLTDDDLYLPETVAICSICAKGYQTVDDCNAHMTCHTEFKEQKRNDQEITLTECCDICDEEFNSTIDLEYHMSLHTGVRHQSNVICVRGFVTRPALTLPVPTFPGIV